MFETARPTKEQWESAFIAIELVRLGHLNSEPILPTVGKTLGGMYKPGSIGPCLIQSRSEPTDFFARS